MSLNDFKQQVSQLSEETPEITQIHTEETTKDITFIYVVISGYTKTDLIDTIISISENTDQIYLEEQYSKNGYDTTLVFSTMNNSE